jgi:hypothetical protein
MWAESGRGYDWLSPPTEPAHWSISPDTAAEVLLHMKNQHGGISGKVLRNPSWRALPNADIVSRRSTPVSFIFFSYGNVTKGCRRRPHY